MGVVNVGHYIGGVVADVATGAGVMVVTELSVSRGFEGGRLERTYALTSRTQYPKVPNETEELWPFVWFVRVTLSILMLLMTGAEMVVMRRRMQAAKMRKVPRW